MDNLIDQKGVNGDLDFPPNGQSIDLLRAVYRNPSIPLPVRIRCAVAALPHEVPRLQVSALVNEQSFAELLDKRLKRIEEMNGQPQTKTQVICIEAPKHVPRIADRLGVRSPIPLEVNRSETSQRPPTSARKDPIQKMPPPRLLCRTPSRHSHSPIKIRSGAMTSPAIRCALSVIGQPQHQKLAAKGSLAQ